MRYSLLIIVLLFIGGCKSTSALEKASHVSELESKEKIFKATNNSEKLIEFYKKELKRNDSEQYRIKLANSYLNILDPESALFVMEPILKRDNVSFESAIVSAKAYLDLGDNNSALTILKDAQKSNSDDGEVYNLLGIIYANKGEWQTSRQMFERARANFYDDIKVKNNLALLDMIEGDDNQALKRISSLTADQLDDEKIHSNLLLIMAKNGHKDYVMEALGPRLSTKQKNQIYQALRNSDHAEEPQAPLLLEPVSNIETTSPISQVRDTASKDVYAEEISNQSLPLDLPAETTDLVSAQSATGSEMPQSDLISEAESIEEQASAVEVVQELAVDSAPQITDQAVDFAPENEISKITPTNSNDLIEKEEQELAPEQSELVVQNSLDSGSLSDKSSQNLDKLTQSEGSVNANAVQSEVEIILEPSSDQEIKESL